MSARNPVALHQAIIGHLHVLTDGNVELMVAEDPTSSQRSEHTQVDVAHAQLYALLILRAGHPRRRDRCPVMCCQVCQCLMNRRLLAVGAQKGGLEVVADDRPGCATEEWGGAVCSGISTMISFRV